MSIQNPAWVVPSRYSVVLVQPEHPHNIGFVARAMRSFGLLDLRIVLRPRQRKIPQRAWVTAHGSGEILTRARLCSSLEEAVQDCQSVVGFSRRLFDSIQEHVNLKELPETSWIQRDRVALVFGRESTGLTLEELNHCSLQCEIPMAGQMSLNLAQAVSVAFYELVGGEVNPPWHQQTRQPACAGDMENLVQWLYTHLTTRVTRHPWSQSALRKWLHRMAPDQGELRALFGFFRSLTGVSARSEKRTNL